MRWILSNVRYSAINSISSISYRLTESIQSVFHNTAIWCFYYQNSYTIIYILFIAEFGTTEVTSYHRVLINWNISNASHLTMP